jgi:hypothetical protein
MGSLLGVSYGLIVYVLFAFGVGVGVPYYFMQQQKLYAAGGFAIAAIACFIYFGMRWFTGLELSATLLPTTAGLTSWPPQINYCPDFMSLVNTGTGSTAQFYCVDTMGVYPGLIGKFTAGATINPPGGQVNALPLTKDKKASEYATTFVGPPYSGITWEGVYDGASASANKPPYPPLPSS